MEQILSGYCRTIDAARMVLLEQDGQQPEADCAYAVCSYREVCEIGKQISALIQEAGGDA